ncbi:MAG: TonB-dependent receptor, partial [Deltaproteobacteria bacterium]|nr:TonB-dependent receptor [Deltaproteobacteria bacterium]
FILSYHVNDDAMVYAQAAQGYRVGNANPAIPDPAVPAEYGPDSLWNYEIGAKTAWFDNHLIANGAIYYIDWTDIQLDLMTGPFNYINNGGEAHSMGLELELSWRPIKGLSLTSAVTLMEAEIDTANEIIGARKGDRMPWVPEFSIANAAQYSFPMFEAAVGHVRIDHQYIGQAYSLFNPADSLEMGDYHQVNFRAGLMFESWEVSLFARNLFDEDGFAFGYRHDILGDMATQQRPRIIGLNVRVRF